MNQMGNCAWPFCLSSLVMGLQLGVTSKAAPSDRVISRSLLQLILLVVSACFAAAQSNPIVVENQKAGNPSSQWDISGSGDPSIQGFATDISVNKGQTIRFKVKTNATNYRLDIYRLGYYRGLRREEWSTRVAPSARRSSDPAQPDYE